MSDIVDKNVSQLNVVLLSCWVGNKDSKGTITLVIDTEMEKGLCCECTLHRHLV